jgi:hypothetical protein
VGLRSLFANRKPQKPLQYEDGFGEPQPQIDIPDQGAPEVPPMDYSSALGALKGSGDASDVRYGLPQNDKPLIDTRSEQDAEDLRYGYNPSNNLKPVDNPDIAQPQQPAIAQAVARKQNGFNLSGVQDALNSHRMHVGDEANQMRTAFSDIGQSVPGVKPLSALDYTQGAKNDISLQQAVEEKKRQRLQDQLAYMKQLESADGQNEWAAVSHKNGMVMYNKRTGEYRPMAEFNEAGKPDTSDLATHIGKVEDRNGNIRDFQYWTSKAGKAYVTGPNGELQEVNLNDIPWANENERADLELKQSQAERENERKSQQAARDGVSVINLNDKTSIGFKGTAPARVIEQITASANVSQAYNGIKKDAKFMGLTTRGKSPEENVKKVMELHREMKGAGPKYQAFLKAQAAALNSGVLQAGERENYIANTLGLDKDLFKNPKYTTDQGLQFNAVSAFQLMAASLLGQALTKADIDRMEGNLTEIARKYPELIDPSRARTALADITRNSVRAAKTSVQTEALRREGLPQGSSSYIKGSFDPEIEEYFGGLFQEEPIDPNSVYNPSPGSIGSVDTPVVNKTQPPASVNPPAKASDKTTKKVGQALKDKVKSKQNSSDPVPINTAAPKSYVPNLLKKFSKQKSKTTTAISSGRQG